MTRSDFRYVWMGAIALLVGTLLYVLFRTHPPVFVNWHFLRPVQIAGSPFEDFVNVFPTFAHVFGFTAISAAFINRWPGAVAGLAALWFLINLFFELMSSQPLEAVAEVFPRYMATALANGTFDPGDIAAAFLGAVAALAVISWEPTRFNPDKGSRHDNETQASPPAPHCHHWDCRSCCMQ